jgi:hypothetical protein
MISGFIYHTLCYTISHYINTIGNTIPQYNPTWIDTKKGSTFESVFQTVGTLLPLLYYKSLTADFVYRDVRKISTPFRGYLFYAYITTVGMWAKLGTPRGCT